MERVVAVTGASGYIGSKLLPWLEKDPAVEKIVNLDVQEPKGHYSKLVHHNVDVTEDFSEVFQQEGVTSAIHLVFIVDPSHNRDRMHSLNVGSATRFFEACKAAGVKRQVIISSNPCCEQHHSG